MGIRQLNKLLSEYTDDSIREINLNKYSGKRIAIDISIYLYKFLHYNGDYLYGLLNQIIKLSFYKIKPIYVFDGKSPKQKENVIHQRKSKVENSYKQIDILKKILKDTSDQKIIDEIHEKLDSLKKKTIHINYQIIDNCKHLLKLLNIPYVESISEAEHLCSYLVNKNIVYACLSEDTDLIPLGCKRVCKQLYFRKNTVIEYNVDKILEELQIDHRGLVDLCILCGTDYNTQHFKGINYELAYYLIHKYKYISDIKSGLNISKIDYHSIYKIYLTNYESLDIHYEKHIQTILCDYNITFPFSSIIEIFKKTKSKKHSGTLIDKLLILERNTHKY